MAQAAISEVAPQPATTTTRRVMITLCATLATASYSFTWNSVGVALPHMQGAFSATTDQITWVMIAFIIGSATITATVGWLSTRFGRKQLFLAAIAGFTVTLLGCGAASTLEEMVIWRFLQGICGAALLPLGQTIAVNAFPPERHAQATSLWALGFVTSNLFAPTIAGQLIDGLGWAWIFHVVVPLGAVLMVASWFLVPVTEKAPRPMDWTGFITLIVGVGALQLMLARGERLDWFESTEILIEAVVAGLGLYLFVAHTATAQKSFVDRALFRNRNYVLGQGFIFLIGSVLFLPLLLLPLLLQQIGDYPAIETGNLLMSRGFGSILGLLIMSQIRSRVDPRPILCFGLLVTGYAAWTMSGWTVEIRPQDVIWANFLQGLASGAVWASLNTLALKGLDKRVQDQGFGLFYLSFDVGNAIGTAAIVGLHARESQINHALLTEHINPFNEVLRYGALRDAWPVDETLGLAALDLEVTRQATMIAYNTSFLVIAGLLMCLIPGILLFRKPVVNPPDRTDE